MKNENVWNKIEELHTIENKLLIESGWCQTKNTRGHKWMWRIEQGGLCYLVNRKLTLELQKAWDNENS
jgi:hypothetical protein